MKMKWEKVQMNVLGTWTFFCKQQKRLENKMSKMHYQKSGASDDKSVVFTCNGWIWHGGLADRLKGIIAVYNWCKCNGRSFKINFVDPFRLQDYLVPNQVEWIPRDIVYNKKYSCPKVCLVEPRTLCRKDVFSRRKELMKQWMDDNLSERNRQLHVYTNIKDEDADFSQCFHELFRPNDVLLQELKYHKHQMDGDYISISFRFTTLLGDFTDCVGEPLPEQERESLIVRSVKAIESIASMAPKHKYILVTSDSVMFLLRAQCISNVYVIPGEVGHIDYKAKNEVNRKTFLDFLMIADAKKVYLAKGPGMYQSAFAQTASLVNKKPFEVYKY